MDLKHWVEILENAYMGLQVDAVLYFDNEGL
jgi:hypothetical protein